MAWNNSLVTFTTLTSYAIEGTPAAGIIKDLESAEKNLLQRRMYWERFGAPEYHRHHPQAEFPEEEALAITLSSLRSNLHSFVYAECAGKDQAAMFEAIPEAVECFRRKFAPR